MNSTTQENSTFQAATFQAAGALYGVEMLRLQEVVNVQEITPVHQAGDDVVGVINLRGSIVTVLDPGWRLQRERLHFGPTSRIVILEQGEERVGILVDRVAETMTIERDRLLPPPANLHSAQPGLFLGVHQAGSDLVCILNVDALLHESTSTGSR